MAGIHNNLNPSFLSQDGDTKKTGNKLNHKNGFQAQKSQVGPCYAQRRNRYDHFDKGDWYESIGMGDDGRHYLFKYISDGADGWSVEVSAMTADEVRSWRYM